MGCRIFCCCFTTSGSFGALTRLQSSGDDEGSSCLLCKRPASLSFSRDLGLSLTRKLGCCHKCSHWHGKSGLLSSDCMLDDDDVVVCVSNAISKIIMFQSAAEPECSHCEVLVSLVGIKTARRSSPHSGGTLPGYPSLQCRSSKARAYHYQTFKI